MTGAQHPQRVVFQLIQCFFREEETEEVLYGVEALEQDAPLFRLSDVTEDRQKMERAIALWNREEVSHWHAWEVVEDFVTELYLPVKGTLNP